MPMITVRIKQVYGNTMYYPVCEPAKLFAKLANHTTLTALDIKLIRELGYKVDVEQQALTV